MAQVLVLSSSPQTNPLPALSLLNHTVRRMTAEPKQIAALPPCDLIFLDATEDLAKRRSLCKIMTRSTTTIPVIVVVTEGGLSAVTADWGAADVILHTAEPAELVARMRLARERCTSSAPSQQIHAQGITINEASYSAKAQGEPLDLTFKEFELLRFFALNPSRVFSREQLLNEVWGHDYFGGTRTVDVHVRRLRAKLGDLESLIGTVRNVGYRFNFSETTTKSS